MLKSIASLLVIAGLITVPLAHAAPVEERPFTTGHELAVAAVVTIGVATVITGGAILAGSSAGLAVFAATSLALIGVQTILKAITNANERAVLGTNVARNASTRSRVDRRSSEASSSGGGTPR